MENIVKKTRNSNFELLRIFSTLLIITNHYCQFGITLPQNYPQNSFFFTKLLFSSWTGAMGNMLFILISGYYLCTSSFSWNKVLKIWFQIFSTSIIIGLIFYIFKIPTIGFYLRDSFEQLGYFQAAKPIGKKELIRAFLPTFMANNWFATRYLVFYLFIPFLNKLLGIINKQEHLYLTILLVLFGTITKMIPGQGLLDPSNFYYFIMGYFVASYIRLYNPQIFNHTSINFIIGLFSILLFSLLNVSLHFLVEKYPSLAPISKFLYIASDLNKFPLLLASIIIFCAFKNFNIRNSKIINNIASTTFGIYLIHTNGFLKIFIWHRIFKIDYFINNPKFTILYIISSIIIVFLICSLLELIRKQIFDIFLFQKIKQIIKRKSSKNEITQTK